MKTNLFLLVLSLSMLLVSCEKPKEVEDGRPRIKAISIAGIPQQNIVFIPERYVINVQLPTVVPEGGLKPTYELTENTEFIEGITADGLFENTCGGMVVKVANDRKTSIYRNTTSYQINFEPAGGCPEVLENSPITYARDSVSGSSFYIQVPLKNPLSSFAVYSIKLKNLSGGQDYDSTIPPYLRQYAYNGCQLGIDNRVRLAYIASPQPSPDPGTYEVSISMSCEGGDKTLTFSQPLVLKE